MNARWLLIIASVAFCSLMSLGRAEEPDSKETAKRFADLEKTLSGATLVGNFSVTGEAAGKLAAERYELGKVKRLQGDQWLIEARIRYGEHNVAVPLALPIRWAGDTPVITVDELPIPGLGTFTARVMIYRDHYAGFWTGKDHGGHLFGVVERADSPKTPETRPESPAQ